MGWKWWLALPIGIEWGQVFLQRVKSNKRNRTPSKWRWELWLQEEPTRSNIVIYIMVLWLWLFELLLVQTSRLKYTSQFNAYALCLHALPIALLSYFHINHSLHSVISQLFFIYHSTYCFHISLGNFLEGLLLIIFHIHPVQISPLAHQAQPLLVNPLVQRVQQSSSNGPATTVIITRHGTVLHNTGLSK